jgi:ABC-type Fe3+/spermidine/putrescine transport system ATPase subunit
MAPYLTAEFHHHLGSFHLDVRFELRSPWSVLFGPSGSGKSTLLRLLAGLEQPDRGDLQCFGTSCVNTAKDLSLPPAKRGMGMVMQQPGLFPHMSAAENVAFALHRVGETERTRRVGEMLDLVAASEFAKRRPAELSGGEQQRVALARTLVQEPRMVLLDEPFSALDGELKDRILARLSGWLGERNIPALYVSHDLSEAFQTNADVLVMHEGRVTARGPAAAVLAADRARLLSHLKV